MSNIKVGKIVEGQITGVTKYGVFVSLEDNYVGMIHNSEVSNKYIEDLILCQLEFIEFDEKYKNSMIFYSYSYFFYY